MKKNCFHAGNHAVVASTMCKMVAATMVLLLLAAGGLRAQDTLYSSQPPDNYLVGCTWPSFDDNRAFLGYEGADVKTICEWAFSCYADTTVAVVGVAAILGTYRTFRDLHSYFNMVEYQDTLIHEYLRTYQYTHGYGLSQVGGSLRWQEVVTPASYYIRMGLEQEPGGTAVPVFPVFELYYDTPVVVHDTFFVGCTNSYGRIIGPYENSEGRYILYETTSLRRPSFRPDPKDPPDGYSVWTCRGKALKDPDPTPYPNQTPSGWCVGFGGGQEYYFFFPILGDSVVLPPDSTETGADTVSIGSGALADRYTKVFPNPAQGSTRVVSSFGLARVEAFTLDGRKVQELKPTGYAADIDVSAWPAGEYVLRIATRQGTVTRRLTVAR